MFAWLLCACGALFLSPSFAQRSSIANDAQERRVSIEDSIEMRRIVDLDFPIVTAKVTNFRFSPNRQYFFIAEHKGDIATDSNTIELKLYSVRDIERFLSAENSVAKPSPRLLARHSTSSNAGNSRVYAIRMARWLDDRTITYIGDDGTNPAQVYKVDIEAGSPEQLTNHPHNVESFGIAKDQSMLMFYASEPIYYEDMNDVAVVAGVRTVGSLANLDRPIWNKACYRLYAMSLNGAPNKRQLGDPFESILGIDAQRYWLSPDGRKVIIALPYKDVSESVVVDYHAISASSFIRESVQEYDPNISTPNDFSFLKFYYVDLERNEWRTIFGDAPTGVTAGAAGFALKAQWFSDGESVVIASSFLPREGTDDAEWERRRRSPAIVHYNVLSGAYTRVTDIEIPAGRSRATTPLYDIQLSNDNELTVTYQSIFGFAESRSTEVFRFGSGEWRSVETPPREDTIVLDHRQSMNMPPELWVKDARTGIERQLTDLNPKFSEIELGLAEPYGWTDESGREWNGTIVYPPQYDAGRTYPLVIQTRGMRGPSASIFMLDGTVSGVGPYAARAIAARDIIVVITPDHPDGHGTYEEVLVQQQGIEALVSQLSEDGTIDANRVGITAFSRSGFYVDHLLWQSDVKFSAAVMSDTSELNFSSYPAGFGLFAPGMRYTETMMGDVVPWGDALDEFISRSSTFNLDKVNTPLRLEVYLDNQGFSGDYWDQYAILRRLHKPVELLLFPKTNHASINPRSRLYSAGGIVDWFDFWLNDVEDLDPAKAKQYARWRALRGQHTANAIGKLGVVSEDKPRR